MGIYMIVWIFKLACSQAFSMIQIYRVIGATWKIITGCIPCLAKHVLIDHQEKTMREMRQQMSRNLEDENIIGMNLFWWHITELYEIHIIC